MSMTLSKKSTFLAAVGTAALIGGLLGGFNLLWSRAASFPVYGYIFDLLAIPAMVALILYARRLKSETTDEFAQTKKRVAAQSGFMIGLLLFLVTGPWPVFFPHTYHTFMQTLSTPEDGYAIGRVAGFAPFIIGLVIGQIVA
eukprot:gene33517-43041_t